MPYLLDTHTFLWFVSGDKKLPKEIKELIKI
jgi:PIN domain nuclease of toxin-antitoxin system